MILGEYMKDCFLFETLWEFWENLGMNICHTLTFTPNISHIVPLHSTKIRSMTLYYLISP